MQNWAKFAGFGAFLVVALVGSLLWALNYPIQQAEWTCQTKPPIEQSTTVTVYKLVRCRPDNALGKFAKAAEATGLKLTDVLLATFTLGLVVVGALQVYWLQQTMKATALAAEAADKSARAAIGIELPIIRAKPDKLHSLETRIDDNAIKVFYSVGGVTLVNLGNTKAFPVEVKSGIVYGKELPSEPSYLSVDPFLPNISIQTQKLRLSKDWLNAQLKFRRATAFFLTKEGLACGSIVVWSTTISCRRDMKPPFAGNGPILAWAWTGDLTARPLTIERLKSGRVEHDARPRSPSATCALTGRRLPLYTASPCDIITACAVASPECTPGASWSRSTG